MSQRAGANFFSLLFPYVMSNTISVGGIEFTKTTNDINGNPRYIFHYLALCKHPNSAGAKHSALMYNIDPKNNNKLYISSIEIDYNNSAKLANKIGGKKYRGKDYGGGIVIQSYNLHQTAKDIKALLA